MSRPQDAPVAVVELSLGRLAVAADLREGTVVELDAASDDRVLIVVDGRAVAEGTLLLDGGELVVRIDRRI